MFFNAKMHISEMKIILHKLRYNTYFLAVYKISEISYCAEDLLYLFVENHNWTVLPRANYLFQSHIF